MRYIQKKGKHNRQLDRANSRGRPQTSAQAQRRWARLNKDTLRRQLLKEQFGLCAYSELSIRAFRKENQSPINGHIEHIIPKSLKPWRTFDYRNLVLSALCSEDLAWLPKEDYFGGHAKLSEYDPRRFISPLQSDCRRFFVYLSETGEIEPAFQLNHRDRGRAQYTIDLLNLNSSYLTNKRKNWMQELEEEVDRRLDNVLALTLLAEAELCHDHGELPAFHSASRQLFGNFGERIIDQTCKECA